MVSFFAEYDEAVREDNLRVSVPQPVATSESTQPRRRANFGPEEDALLLTYILTNPKKTWSGIVIYRDLSETHPWRSSQSWRNRYAKHLKLIIDNFETTHSLNGIPPHLSGILQGWLTSQTPVGTRVPVTRSSSARGESQPIDTIEILDSDEEMFIDERPGEFSQGEKAKEQPDSIDISDDDSSPSPFESSRKLSFDSLPAPTNPKVSRKARVSRIADSNKASDKGIRPHSPELHNDNNSPVSDDYSPLFFGENSPLSSPYNTTKNIASGSEIASLPSTAQLNKELDDRYVVSSDSDVESENDKQHPRNRSPSLGSPSYFS